MPRNQFTKNEPYICDACLAGEHWRCHRPGVCQCEEAVDPPVDITPPVKQIEEKDLDVLKAEQRLARLRMEEGFTTTEAHVKYYRRDMHL